MQFSQDSIESLEKKLIKSGFSNMDYSIFDLTDDRVSSLYKKLQKSLDPSDKSKDEWFWNEVENRDKKYWKKIERTITEHVSSHGDKTLVLLTFASPHVYGAIPLLESKIKARYISGTLLKLSIDIVINYHGSTLRHFKGSTDVEKALGEIEWQMKRDLTAVMHLGYENIEKFLEDRSKVKNPKNLILALEETGFHPLYRDMYKNKNLTVFKFISDFVKQEKPSSILHIWEGFPEPLAAIRESKEFEEGLCIPVKHVQI